MAVGLGAPPVDALRTNKVQALLFWASAQATFENAGLKLRYLIGPDWRTYPDFTFSTLQKTIDSDPAMVEAIARGAAKATIFAWTNPDCARRIHWSRYPNTKPSGVDEATAQFVAETFAMGAGVGVTLAIVRKGRILFWTAVGVALAVYRGIHQVETGQSSE